MDNRWGNFVSPFTKTAGAKALLWGVIGLTVSVVAASVSRWHAHGLLHFGPAARDAWWISALEYLIIWLIPALIFYGLGTALSRSRIRLIDVLGTTAFSLLPIAVMNLMHSLPCMRNLYTPFVNIVGLVVRPLVIVDVVVVLIVIVLMLVWLFNAVKVSCNLKGWRLWVVCLVGVIGGDIVCRLLIGMLY